VAATSATAVPTESAAGAPLGDIGDRVKIAIESNTDGFEVFLGSDKIGASDAPVTLPRSSNRVKLTVKKTGFAPRDVWVTPAHDLTLSTELTKLAVGATAPPGKGPPGKSSASPTAAPRASSGELEF
jgi:hypothetical protein